MRFLIYSFLSTVAIASLGLLTVMLVHWEGILRSKIKARQAKKYSLPHAEFLQSGADAGGGCVRLGGAVERF